MKNQSLVETALDFGHSDIVFMLIKHGCHLSQRVLSATNSRGNTLLHIACEQNRVAVAKKLIEAGSSLSVTNKNRKSVMHYAWRNGELRNTVLDHVFGYRCKRQIKLELLQRNDDSFRSACRNNDDEPTADELALYITLCTVVSEVPLGLCAIIIADTLCSRCGKLTPEACHILQGRGMFDHVLLLSACCGTSYANKQLALQLLIARRLSSEVSESDLKFGIEKCIQKGANVNAADCRGNTPLHLACRDSDCRDIVRILLNCGANPYVVNNEGRTPLDCAADKQRGQLLLSLIDHVDDDILSTVSSKGEASTKLLMLASAGVLSQQLAYRLACDGARINPPATSSCDSNARRYYLSCILDILAWKDKWSVVCELVRMGCCDYTDDMFKSMFQISLRDTTNFYNKVPMWKWFSLAGFWQNNDFTAELESFLEVEFHRWQPKRDTHTDSRAATATSELEWLKDDVRNPPSLLRQCVYTIRRQLILADTADGRSIFPSIEKLPLPTKLKDSLKLEDLDAPVVCFADAENLGLLVVQCHDPY